MYTYRVAFALTGLALVVPNLAGAQRVNDEQRFAEARRAAVMSQRVPVTLAVVEHLDAPSAFHALVVRGASARSVADTILLRESATGGDLSAAVVHLMIMRERAGDTASVSAQFRVPPSQDGQRLKGLPNAEAVLARLKASTPRSVAGYGAIRARTVYLPGKAMRDAARSRGRSGP